MKSIRTTTFFLVLLVLYACTSQQRHEQALQKVKSIINEHPDSAMKMLDEMEVHADGFSKRTRMQWLMLRVSAQNKCYIDFVSDSIPKLLVDYYDHHGSPNERMTAHYLLGRAYHDMGEAPMALRCYQDAVECADTLSKDCDFYTLCSIHGQMAMIFNEQHLHKESIEMLKLHSYYAQRDHNVLSSIKGKELQMLSYFAMDDTASCFKLTEECHRLYTANGFPEKAASIYPTAILILLQDGQWQRAHGLMQEYEGASGLFDKNGNIAPGKEKYYYCKGLYYMLTHQTDSAEFFFRKLLGFHQNRDYEAYKGLQNVYHERRNADSVMKYSTLCEQALDSIQKDDQSDALAITHSLYNYSRQEKMAAKKSLEAEQTKWRMTLAIILVLLAAALLLYLSYQKRRKKEKELGEMNTSYMEAVKKQELLKQELQMLEIDRDGIIESKQKEISALQKEIERYKMTFDNLPDHDKEAAIMGNKVVHSFEDMAKGKRDVPMPTEGDWQSLIGLFSKNLPAFYGEILLNDGLTKLEKEICMLCRLNFPNGEMAVLLDKSTQSVTNIKSKVNFKLFGEKSATSLKKNFMRLGM